MSFVTREKCVLKLVYPGRFVELHTEPITVAEVMRKHPRHCITRPDVFQFPWIVVRPDSVLKPGGVFFVVPYHTIRRLLQGKRSQDQSSIQEFHPPDQSQDHVPHLRQTSALDSSTTLRPDHIGYESFCRRKSNILCLSKHNTIVHANSMDDQSPEQNYPVGCSVKLTNFRRLLGKQSQNFSQSKEKVEPPDCRAGCLRQKYQVEAGSRVMGSNIYYHDEPIGKSQKQSHAKVKSQHDGDQYHKKRYPVEKWPTAIAIYKDHQRHSVPQAQVNPLDEASPFYHTRQYDCNTKTDIGSDLENSKQVPQLKSCLKKHEADASKSRALRVTFAFPLEDKRKKSKTKSFKFHQIMERL